MRLLTSFTFEGIKNYRFARVMWHDGGESKKRECRKDEIVSSTYKYSTVASAAIRYYGTKEATQHCHGATKREPLQLLRL
jgi:hypothetical protein